METVKDIHSILMYIHDTWEYHNVDVDGRDLVTFTAVFSGANCP
jgi:hypothetical protein